MCSLDKNKIIKFEIDNLEKLHKLLYHDREMAGLINLDTNLKKTTNISEIEGNTDSVDAPESLINYHTHPFSCYQSEKTIWGFPSGEDTRESVLSALSGNIVHLVITIEGIYVCQVLPEFLTNLIEININDLPEKSQKFFKKYKLNPNDFYRGLIITCIEIYFKTTHGFRCYEVIKKYDISTDDYLSFINNFSFQNIFQDDPVKGCQRLKCEKLWFFDKQLKKYSFEKYCSLYEIDTHVYLYNLKKGISILDFKINDIIKRGLLDPLKSFKTGKCFKVDLFPHKVTCNDNFSDNYINLSRDHKWEIIQNSGIKHFDIIEKPYFIYYDLIGRCKDDDIKKDLLYNFTKSQSKLKSRSRSFGKDYEYILFGSYQCPYCIDAKKELKHLNIKFIMYDSISQAIESARRYSGQLIKTIPAVFKGKKLIDRTKLQK